MADIERVILRAYDAKENHVAGAYGVNRERLMIVLKFATLPDEAFGFFAGTMLNMSREAGGFQSDSRAAIEALGPLVERYYELKSEKPQIHEKK